jgi:PHP family Zn ribbon phosphoesterase
MKTRKRHNINFNLPVYNHATRMYENAEATLQFSRFADARLHQWKCEKCGQKFSKYKGLADHKSDLHSY